MSVRTDLFNLIGVLARRRFQEGERAFATLGLNHTEARLLTLLSENGGSAKQDALSTRVNVDRSNVGRALKKLEQMQLVTRRQDCDNGKTFFVNMTDDGKVMAQRILTLREEMAQRFFASLSDEEAEAAFSILQNCLKGNSPQTAAGQENSSSQADGSGLPTAEEVN